MPLANSSDVAASRIVASAPDSLGLRRRAPRLEVPRGLVRAEIPGLNLTADVRDVSTGGFSIETFRPFAQGSVHQFKLKTSSGWSGVARAKAAHCRWLNDPDGSVRFLSGWQYLFDTNLAAEPINEQLVDAVAELLRGGTSPAPDDITG
jgi:hypothetical protein